MYIHLLSKVVFNRINSLFLILRIFTSIICDVPYQKVESFHTNWKSDRIADSSPSTVPIICKMQIHTYLTEWTIKVEALIVNYSSMSIQQVSAVYITHTLNLYIRHGYTKKAQWPFFCSNSMSLALFLQIIVIFLKASLCIYCKAEVNAHNSSK